jgi:uncharacterized protein (UPF0276 family)
VGLGWREELASDLLNSPTSVDFIEFIAETAFVHPATHRQALALREIWPVFVHGVKLSLGSVYGVEDEKFARFAKLARDVRAPMVSEHVSFTQAGGREIGHLTALSRTRASIDALTRNVNRLRRHLGSIELILENTVSTFEWPNESMNEGEFYGEVVRSTGSRLLLDIENLYANAVNRGIDPAQALAEFPLEEVGMVHLAGGCFENGFFYDTHAHAISSEVFQLLRQAICRTGNVPILIERDDRFPPFAELLGEVMHVRAILREKAPASAHGRALVPMLRPVSEAALDVLAREQETTAYLLTSAQLLPNAEFALDPRALTRTRALLAEKRFDDAIPLLPHLFAHKAKVREHLRQMLNSIPRINGLQAVFDAWAIAKHSRTHSTLGDLAIRDQLLLRARFVIDEHLHVVKLRRLPFFGHARLSQGQPILAIKAPGAAATVYLSKRNSSEAWR